MEGLREVVVTAGFQTADPIGRIAPRSQKEDRRIVTVLAQSAADGEAVNPRQHDIQDDDRDTLVLQKIERLLAVIHEMDPVPFRAEVFYDAGRKMRVVFHDQHAGRGGRRASVRSHFRRRGRHAGSAGAAGQARVNLAPCPTPSLWALTRPPASCIRRLTMNRPSPVP